MLKEKLLEVPKTANRRCLTSSRYLQPPAPSLELVKPDRHRLFVEKVWSKSTEDLQPKPGT